MTRESTYAAGFLEQSLGLAAGELEPGDVPNGFVNELASVLRGRPLRNTRKPALETKVLQILRSIERRSSRTGASS